MSQAEAYRATAANAPGPLLAGVAYLGAVGMLGTQVIGALARPRKGWLGAILHQLSEVISSALGIVLLVHFSIGSFLAMQSFFGATFREASGAVVGVGLVRNLATLLTGFILAGLLAARGVAAREDDPGDEPTRILGAALAGPVLACWGAAMGLISGLLVARSLLGVAPGLFLGKFSEMVQSTDALGLVVKGAGFAGVAALMAEHEARRGRAGLSSSARRAAILSIAAIVFLNGTWFSLAYLSGHPFGPALEPRR